MLASLAYSTQKTILTPEPWSCLYSLKIIEKEDLVQQFSSSDLEILSSISSMWLSVPILSHSFYL